MSEAPLSKLEQHRQDLKRRLDSGRISQADYDFQMARNKKRGKKSQTASGIRLSVVKAQRLFTEGQIDEATHVEHLAQSAKRSAKAGIPLPPSSPSVASSPPAGEDYSPSVKLSLKRRQALASVQSKHRDAIERRRQSLSIPAGFDSVPAFIATLRDIAGRRSGGNAALARHCNVSTSTISKWFRLKKPLVPDQTNLDKLAAWHRAQLGDDRASSSARPNEALPISRGPSAVSLARLSPELSSRLKRTAHLRNLTPLKLAEQILDRHLPKKDELDR